MLNVNLAVVRFANQDASKQVEQILGKINERLFYNKTVFLHEPQFY